MILPLYTEGRKFLRINEFFLKNNILRTIIEFGLGNYTVWAIILVLIYLITMLNEYVEHHCKWENDTSNFILVIHSGFRNLTLVSRETYELQVQKSLAEFIELNLLQRDNFSKIINIEGGFYFFFLTTLRVSKLIVPIMKACPKC